VVDDEEGLSGIFTAKDLAYRVRLSCHLIELKYHVLTTVAVAGYRRRPRSAHYTRASDNDP